MNSCAISKLCLSKYEGKKVDDLYWNYNTQWHEILATVHVVIKAYFLFDNLFPFPIRAAVVRGLRLRFQDIISERSPLCCTSDSDSDSILHLSTC
ncbi:hypothetical protein VNO77_21793 [Canavalia gladiata]|uniref:Uncharacterized protein n=1 Tax=Canavalia gladiata TaxID=3824 RepID=A0AAN9L1D6_CANGL